MDCVKKILSKWDIILILFVLVLFALILVIKPAANGNSYVEIKTPEGVYIYPLTEDRSLSFDGLIGKSYIEIKDGKAFFTSSPCPGKNCISEGSISESNAFCACLPNGISITVTGDNSVDAVSI